MVTSFQPNLCLLRRSVDPFIHVPRPIRWFVITVFDGLDGYSFVVVRSPRPIQAALSFGRNHNLTTSPILLIRHQHFLLLGPCAIRNVEIIMTTVVRPSVVTPFVADKSNKLNRIKTNWRERKPPTRQEKPNYRTECQHCHRSRRRQQHPPHLRVVELR